MPSREAAESPRSASRRQAAAPKDGAGLLSPRFRSAAALAGWDEESILLAALVVEDTPVRESRRKRRLSSSASGSAGSSTRKRRSRRQSPGRIPPVVLALDDDEKPDNSADGKKEVKEKEEEEEEEEKVVVVGENEASGSGDKAAAPTSKLPCMDRLQEELSCAICLEICFEPSTTPCGHSFCMRCLKHAAAKCGKRCPKCRQLISNSRSVTINTVLWNTIQLLFPGEVEARRTSMASSSSCNDDVNQSSPRSSSFSQVGVRTRSSSGNFITEGRTRSSHRSFVTPGITSSSNSHRSFVTPASTTSSNTSGNFISAHRGRSFVSATRVINRTGFVPASHMVTTRRNSVRSDQSEDTSQLVSTRRSSVRSDQSEDAALAYRLQQEEFMTAFETEEEEAAPPQNTVATARENLRAMAARASRLRARGWPI